MGCAGTGGMRTPLVPDALRETIEAVLPGEPPKPKGGRPRVPDRARPTGIVFAPKSGVSWELLPAAVGRGAGMTGWRRRRDRQAAGAGRRRHRALLDRLGDADRIDRGRACSDRAGIPAAQGAPRPGRTRRTAASRARDATSWSTATGRPTPPA